MKTVFILFLVYFLSSCSSYTEQNQPLSETVLELRWGNSFGMCVGLCIEENHFIYGTTIKQTLSSWTDSYAQKSCSMELSRVQTDSIASLIDKQSFLALPEQIGCPDCADGGATWIEILFTDQSAHKVTFEYFNEPESIKKLAEALRKKSEFLRQHCYAQANQPN